MLWKLYVENRKEKREKRKIYIVDITYILCQTRKRKRKQE